MACNDSGVGGAMTTSDGMRPSACTDEMFGPERKAEWKADQ
ncbi:MAG TPA: hypothetical protein VHB77_17450 [Planctomycetaceae bacterium]|nr:hypothetical protein [Planctomycetaceae bacterium]